MMHQQIGHVPRNMAAKLAPFLVYLPPRTSYGVFHALTNALQDSQKLVAEARLTGPKDFFDAPMEFK